MSASEIDEFEAVQSGALGLDDGADRRRHMRLEHEAVDAATITVLNISLGGICVSLDRPVERGERYTLVLADSRVTGAQELRAEVAWTKRGRTGLKWLDLKPDQFLWLCERLGFWWGPGHRFSVLAARPELVD